MSALLYLDLFHGRKDLYADMNGWGEVGPMLGPLTAVHTVYAETVTVETTSGDGIFLDVKEGCIYYDGMWYGDWAVVAIPTRAPEAPDQNRAKVKPSDPQGNLTYADLLNRLARFPANKLKENVTFLVDGEYLPLRPGQLTFAGNDQDVLDPGHLYLDLDAAAESEQKEG